MAKVSSANPGSDKSHIMFLYWETFDCLSGQYCLAGPILTPQNTPFTMGASMNLMFTVSNECKLMVVMFWPVNES